VRAGAGRAELSGGPGFRPAERLADAGCMGRRRRFPVPEMGRSRAMLFDSCHFYGILEVACFLTAVP